MTISPNPNSSTVVCTPSKAPHEGGTQVRGGGRGPPSSPVADLVPSLFPQPYLGYKLPKDCVACPVTEGRI